MLSAKSRCCVPLCCNHPPNQRCSISLGQEPVGLMRNLLHGMDSGPKYSNLSLHSHHYVPQNHAILTSLPHLLATITLSPTDS